MEYLNTRQVAEILGLSGRTISNWRRRGSGPPWYRVGGAIRYLRHEVDAWVITQASTESSSEEDE